MGLKMVALIMSTTDMKKYKVGFYDGKFLPFHNNKNLVINESTKNSGYIAIKSKKSGKQKIRIVKDDITYTYNIGNIFEFFPLQMGSGQYIIKLFTNISGRKYYTEGYIRLDVKLKTEYCPYLHGNQYVDCSITSIVNKVKKDFCVLPTIDRIDAIKEYIKNEYEYDYIKSFIIKKVGELPDIKTCFEKKIGICQDLAGLTAAIYRIAGIPCKLVIGYIDNSIYHAWNEIYVGGNWEIFDPTKAIQGGKVNSYTKERWY